MAHQGHPGRRARQPAGGAHGARLAPGGRQRPAPRRDPRRRRVEPPGSGSSPAPSTTTTSRRTSAGTRSTPIPTTGEGGRLTLDFRPLVQHVEASRREQWDQVKPMLQCFEHWFGPYPWYRDGYQLIEAPHLGMEHQSAVAYGNGYRNGYKGHGSLRHGLGADLGLHRDPRERPRVVGQQPHDRRRRGHVGARELRQLLGIAVHRMPVRYSGRRRVSARHPQAGQERQAHRRHRTE